MRRVDAVRLLYGTALVCTSAPVVRSVSGRLGEPDEQARTTSQVIRVLGARHLLQGAAAVTLGSAEGPALWWHRVAGVVDLLHLASLPVLALVASPAQRRLIALDAPTEALFARTELRS
jgi:hypothetical protein